MRLFVISLAEKLEGFLCAIPIYLVDGIHSIASSETHFSYGRVATSYLFEFSPFHQQAARSFFVLPYAYSKILYPRPIATFLKTTNKDINIFI